MDTNVTVEIPTVNGPGRITIKQFGTNDVEVTVIRPGQNRVITAIVSFEELYKTLWDYNDLHDFTSSALARVVRLPRNRWRPHSIMQLHFCRAELETVRWKDLREALDKIRRANSTLTTATLPSGSTYPAVQLKDGILLTHPLLTLERLGERYEQAILQALEKKKNRLAVRAAAGTGFQYILPIGTNWRAPMSVHKGKGRTVIAYYHSI